MKVTKVEPQKNCKFRVSVFVDDEYSFSLDETDAVRLGIKCGKVLSERDIENCIMECNFSKAREKAFDILSRKPLSAKELSGKLSEKGYDKAVILEVINELEELGYINDYDYAMLFFEHCKEKMWGAKKIRYEMSLRGIPGDIAEEILQDNDEYERIEEMKEIIISKYSSRDLGEMKTKASVVRYFASRGFDFSIINSALDAAIKELANE